MGLGKPHENAAATRERVNLSPAKNEQGQVRTPQHRTPETASNLQTAFKDIFMVLAIPFPRSFANFPRLPFEGFGFRRLLASSRSNIQRGGSVTRGLC